MLLALSNNATIVIVAFFVLIGVVTIFGPNRKQP